MVRYIILHQNKLFHMKHYCIKYYDERSEAHYIDRTDPEEAFIDAIDILDNLSDYDVELWIENH